MKAANRIARIFAVMCFVAVVAGVFSPRVFAQDQGWLVTRADYGYKNQRNDVTDLINDLISRGGVNGRVAVNNQTMGGDPAPGADKSLRIFARNRRGEEREFDYKEGGAGVDVTMFTVPAPSSDWGDRSRGDRDDHDRAYGGRDSNDRSDLWIIRGFYGVQSQQANVTDLLRSMVRGGTLAVIVNNRSLGGDPAPGADKVLIVIYRYQDREAATAIREGNTLSIP
jgi:hypothetical protein